MNDKRENRTSRGLIVCPPGLEHLLAAELVSLGVKPLHIGRGSVACRLTTRQLYAANRSLRCATRVLIRIADFTARSFPELERMISNVDWDPWLSSEAHPVYRITSHSSRLRHTGAIKERFSRYLGEGGMRDSIQLLVVRAIQDRFVISVDSSGSPLHERGWRQATGRAPLRESVAAGLLMAADWNPATPLVDPMCGSGTIVIEAALRSIGKQPGADRDFAFCRWPIFKPGTWASVTADSANTSFDIPRILASDRDAGVLEAAMANAKRAGVAEIVTFRKATISELSAAVEPKGNLVTNPPWGGRLVSNRDLRNLYATLGRVARERLPGWTLGVLTTNRRLSRQVGENLTEVLRLNLGGRDATFLTAEIV